MKSKKLILLIGLLLLSLRLTSGILTTAQTQEEIDLTKGLVAYWSFDEGEGDIVFDDSGNHNDGVLMCAGEDCSPPKWVQGKIGFAIEFDGKDDYIEISHSHCFDFEADTNFTITVWVKKEKGSGQALLNKYNGRYLGWRFDLPGVVVFKAGHGDSWDVEAIAGQKIVDLDWHHIVIVVNRAEKVLIYVDAQLEGSVTATIADWDYGAPIRLGTYSWTDTQNFKGIIDEVRIYHRALNKDEIDRLIKMRK